MLGHAPSLMNSTNFAPPTTAAPATSLVSSSLRFLKHGEQTNMRPPAFAKFAINSFSGAKPSSWIESATPFCDRRVAFDREEHDGLLVGGDRRVGDDECDGGLVRVVEAVGQTDDVFAWHAHLLWRWLKPGASCARGETANSRFGANPVRLGVWVVREQGVARHAAPRRADRQARRRPAQ